LNPTRPLPEGWVPNPTLVASLKEEFGALLDLNLSLRRFRNHYSEGQTARNWDARFENWVLSDAEKVKARSGTDDLGIPMGQRPSRIRPAQPGDPGYVDPEELHAAARALSDQT
jgi:hypothetical protein